MRKEDKAIIIFIATVVIDQFGLLANSTDDYDTFVIKAQ
jgi:hypothetical protein